MIRHYNFIQWLLLPCHILFSVIGFYLSWRLVDNFLGNIFHNFDSVLPEMVRRHEQAITIGIVTGVLVISCLIALNMWLHGETSLPGPLSAVPSFRTPFRSYGEVAIVEYNTLFLIIGNILLFGLYKSCLD